MDTYPWVPNKKLKKPKKKNFFQNFQKIFFFNDMSQNSKNSNKKCQAMNYSIITKLQFFNFGTLKLCEDRRYHLTRPCQKTAPIKSLFSMVQIFFCKIGEIA